MAQGFLTQQSDRTTAGTDNLNLAAVDYVLGQKFTLSEDGTITEIGWYCDDSGAASAIVRFGIMSDNAGNPGTLISGTDAGEQIIDQSANWFAVTGLSVALNAGDYWICVYTGDVDFDAEGVLLAGSGTSFTSNTAQHGATYPTWPSNFTHTDRVYNCAVYAVYTAAGGLSILQLAQSLGGNANIMTA